MPFFQHDVNSKAAYYSDKAYHLRLSQGANHQTVSSESFHEEPLAGIEHSVQKNYLPCKFPVPVNKQKQEKQQQAPD